MDDLDNLLSKYGIDLSSEDQNTQTSIDNNMSLDLIENGQSNNTDSQSEYSDLEVIRARICQMEEEAKLSKLQSEIDQEILNTPVQMSSAKRLNTSATYYNLSEQKEADARSVFVGNVPYLSKAEELETHFHSCGAINRVTILLNKFNGKSKGLAYIEFADMDSVKKAMMMDNSIIRGRRIRVSPKRTNKPGIRTMYPHQCHPMSWGTAQLSYNDGYMPLYRPRGGYSRRAMHYPY